MNDTERYRVGVMIPSPNTVFERDLARFLPENVTAHFARMWLDESDGSGRASDRMVDDGLELAAKQLRSVRPHLIVFACTSAAASRGPSGEQQILRDIERVAGVRAISLMEECRQSIRARGARRVAVITPYGKAATEDVAREVEALGVTVAKVDAMTYPSGFAIGEALPEDIAAFAIA
ncbi:MAG: Asp/Glu racemase, partial [Dehalococcoidia bacterium]|nr:Asp/Glu racemase [Dehalococcoidia bacterium]